jgi:hypothetical protein
MKKRRDGIEEVRGVRGPGWKGWKNGSKQPIITYKQPINTYVTVRGPGLEERRWGLRITAAQPGGCISQHNQIKAE